MCEKSVKIGHFSHVFHMVFHIHTPSSAGGSGEQPEALWNGKSGGVGAQTVNNPPWGGVWIFSGTTQ